MNKCVSIALALSALPVIASAQVTNAVAQERVKLRQGIKVEIGGKLVGNLRFSSFEYERGVRQGINSEGWSVPFYTGETFEGYEGQLDHTKNNQTQGLYQLAHDIATGKVIKTRAGHRIIFDDTDGNERAAITWNECWLSQITFPGSVGVAEGDGVALRFLSASPGDRKVPPVKRGVWDSRSEVWNTCRVFLDDTELLGLKDFDPIQITLPRFPDPTQPDGAPSIAPTLMTFEDDAAVPVLGPPGTPHTMRVVYSSRDGHELVLTLSVSGIQAFSPNTIFDELTKKRPPQVKVTWGTLPNFRFR